MLGEVYELALSKAEEVRKAAEEAWVPYEAVSEAWVPYIGGGAGGSIKLCGVDGGRNYIEYADYVVYVVNAEGVIYRGEEAEEPVRLFEVDVLLPYRYVEERIRTYCEILELKTALKALEERGVDEVLLDGSLISTLIKPLYAERGKRLSGIDRFILKLEDVSPSVPKVVSKEAWVELKRDYGGEAGRALSFLSGVEKLLVLRRLLEVGEGRLTFISKTSRGVDYFSSPKPDLALFQRFTKGLGYSRPLEYCIGDKVSKKFPVHLEFFRSLKLTLFYARLEEEGPVLRFEVPGAVSKGRVEELLCKLLPYVVAGYPYPLSKAHLDVEVSDEEVESIARVIGLHRAGVGALG
ncbi:MAG: DNA double-strand break repair nuclease NurA [Candidatus Nezhaarchaeota archaeon]|nr:DNA double-strand break repair nuclease NurA [Candidatus Nezhaarchaeota archaeon]